MSTLHDLIQNGQIPPFEHRESIQSYVRRVYRAGVLDGVSWGVAQVAPVMPVIQPEPVPEPVVSEPETNNEGEATSDEEPETFDIPPTQDGVHDGA